MSTWPKKLTSEEKARISQLNSEGLSPPEIAKVLGRSTSVVRKYLNPNTGVDTQFNKSLWDVLGRGLK